MLTDPPPTPPGGAVPGRDPRRHGRLRRRPGPTGGQVVRVVRVDVDLLQRHRVPHVSAISGERPAQPVAVEVRDAPWWPWLLLLAGLVGVLLLLAFHHRMCRWQTIWVPVSEGDLRRARRRAWRWSIGVGAALLLLVGAVAAAWVGSSAAPIVLGLVAGALALVCGQRATSSGRLVRARLDDDGQAVVLEHVAIELLDELEAAAA